MPSDSSNYIIGATVASVGIGFGFWLGQLSSNRSQQKRYSNQHFYDRSKRSGHSDGCEFENREPGTKKEPGLPWETEPRKKPAAALERPAIRRNTSVYQDEIKEGAVIIVDPLSSGAVLALELSKRHFQVVKLMSQNFPERLTNFVPESARNLKYLCNFEFLDSAKFDEDVDSVVQQIRRMDFPVQAVIAGTETGVEVCDAVAQRLGLPNNGPSMSHVRRDKFLMGEQVARAGMRAVVQAKATTWESVEEFVKKLNAEPFQVIIKPLDSAGSDNVACCTSTEQLKFMFDKIMGKTNVLGGINRAVVVQEYLKGTEYVIDTVSRFGKHKVVAVWTYDKRPCNGADFVYFGMRLISGETPLAKMLITYMLRVLNALNIVNSCGHGEVVMTETGPCLVEVGARPHGGEAIWAPMAQECFGYTQLSVCILSNVNPERFRSIPDIPVLGQKQAMEVMLVSRQAGKLIALPKLKEVTSLESYHCHQLECKIGQHMPVTIDYLSTPGSIILIGSTKEQLEADFEAIRKMELTGFFVLE